jgi:hypothetical protein
VGITSAQDARPVHARDSRPWLHQPAGIHVHQNVLANGSPDVHYKSGLLQQIATQNVEVRRVVRNSRYLRHSGKYNLRTQRKSLHFFIATWLQDAAPAAPAVLPPVAAEAPVIPAGPPPGPPGPPGDFPMDGSRPFAGGPPTPNPKQCKVNYLKVRFQHKI